MNSFAIYWIILVAIGYYAAVFFFRRDPAKKHLLTLVLFTALAVRVVSAAAWQRGDPFDIDSWQLLAKSVLERQDLYADPQVMKPIIRHPWFPFQIYIFAASELLSRWWQAPFVTVVKVLPIIADVGLTALVYFGARVRFNDTFLVDRLSLLYALNPLSVLDVSYHGQFDSIPLFFAIAAWYALEVSSDKRRGALLAGILLGTAILDKTWPLIFIPLFLIQMRGWRERIVFAATALVVPEIGILTYSFIFASPVLSILATVLSYQSNPGMWGWTQVARVFKMSPANEPDMLLWARIIMLSAFAFYYVVRAPRLQLLDNMFGAVLLLYVFAPGFNVYYVMWLVPFALLSNAVLPLSLFIAPAFLWLALFYFGGLFPPIFPTTIFNSSFPLTTYELLAISLWLFTVGWLGMNLRRIPSTLSPKSSE